MPTDQTILDLIKDFQNQITDLKSQITDLKIQIDAKKIRQITYPIDDASRKTIGMGVLGPKNTSATTASGYVTVDTNLGPVKVLVV